MGNGDDKYYVPDISEFYIGFGYERYMFTVVKDEETNLSHHEGNWQAEMASFSSIRDLMSLVNMEGFDLSEYRVKKLDRADIEELGWVKKEDEVYELGDNQIDIGALNDDGRIEIYGYLNYYDRSGYPSILYNGFCRNKSRLRLLMQDLRIEA